jgi:hypothetical protein
MERKERSFYSDVKALKALEAARTFRSPKVRMKGATLWRWPLNRNGFNEVF